MHLGGWQLAFAGCVLLGGPALAQSTPGDGGLLHGTRMQPGVVGMGSQPSAEGGQAPGTGCGWPPHLLVDVVAEHGPVAVHSSLSVKQLEELADRVGGRSKHRPLGFYSGLFAYGIRVAIPDAPPANKACIESVHLTVDLSLSDRRIEIGREVADNACLFHAVFAHYSRHAAFDDDVLSRFARWATAALRDAPTPLLLEDAQRAEPVRERLAAFVKKVIEPELPALTDKRNAASETVDTPDEIQRLEEGCPTHA